jgi:hypothetical protein
VWNDHPDPVAARLLARGMAAALGSRATARRRRVLGEPLCMYRVPVPDEHFVFSVGVSEGACVVEGRHRRESALPVTFAVAFRRPQQGNTLEVPELSAAVGCSVYVPPEGTWPAAASLLLRAPVLAEARRIDWTGVVEMSLYDVYVRAVVRTQDARGVAAQVRAIQALAHRVCISAPPAAELVAAAEGGPK